MALAADVAAAGAPPPSVFYHAASGRCDRYTGGRRQEAELLASTSDAWLAARFLGATTARWSIGRGRGCKCTRLSSVRARWARRNGSCVISSPGWLAAILAAPAGSTAARTMRLSSSRSAHRLASHQAGRPNKQPLIGNWISGPSSYRRASGSSSCRNFRGGRCCYARSRYWCWCYY